MNGLEDYKKYRWFYTSSNFLVVGGKSALQNDQLIKKLKEKEEEYIVMHTSTPGSPFSIIMAPKSKVKEKDIKETAIFTGCFSRAWRAKKKTATINIFTLSQLSKDKSMKTGTWSVKGKVEKKVASLELILTKQKNILRAIPESAVKKDKLVKIKPGNIPKQDALSKFQLEISKPLNQEELLSALPTGGLTISKLK